MPGTIAIAAYRTKVLAVLDDASQTRYTSAQVDQALRLALAEYSTSRPIDTTYSLDADGTQRLALPSDFVARYVYGLENRATYPPIIYPIYAYNEDETWIIETPQHTIPTGTTLTVLYGSPQFIDGLDSAAGTTILDEHADILSLGAAGFALADRANSRNETVNIDHDAAEIMLRQSAHYLTKFHAFLNRPATRQSQALWTLDTDSNY
jgi:hypothetical protein